MGTGLRLSHDGPEVVTVVVCRPPDNFFSAAMCFELTELLLRPEDGQHVLRLRGQEGVFCRGRDRNHRGSAEARTVVAALTALVRALHETNLVTVAEVDGDAAGFGVGLAALCDVTIASERARFWFPEVTHGLAPALVLSWLPQVVGRRQAFWLTATGSVLDAEAAKQLGLVNAVCPSDSLEPAGDQVLASILRYPHPVHAEIKRDLRDFEGLGSRARDEMARDRLLLSAAAQ